MNMSQLNNISVMYGMIMKLENIPTLPLQDYLACCGANDDQFYEEKK